jgi:hypothetical protein
MRSGSTLLLHILASHPAILACGERNRPYRSRRDLDRLEAVARFHRRTPLRPYRYVVDQVNHNHLLVNETLLAEGGVRTILLIREPEGALTSMVEVLGRFYGMSAIQALEYYVDRLAALAGYGQRVGDPRHGFFLTYDDLISSTEPTLRALERFLALEMPLSERYQRFPFTGRRGDPGDQIRAGRIVRNASRERVIVDAALVARARSAFEACHATLAERFAGP